MARRRSRFDAAFKPKVALEAIRELKTIAEIAKQFKVHPNQVTMWKNRARMAFLSLLMATMRASLNASSLSIFSPWKTVDR